ncbi:hypothetical protein IG631_05189 [Alternaria alternata]|nr:hypothetical protein IG631_05189 [Alternaria alternata]
MPRYLIARIIRIHSSRRPQSLSLARPLVSSTLRKSPTISATHVAHVREHAVLGASPGIRVDGESAAQHDQMELRTGCRAPGTRVGVI